MGSRSVLLISPYFLPSNLAGVQRVRVMSRALKDYGWIPIVVSVEADSYEEPSDYMSLQLLPKDLAIERVAAWPAKLCRTFGIGDMSLRAQWALRRRVLKLIKQRQPSIIFATVLPGYTSLVGAWAKRRFKIPFVLDYQDPWVSDWGAQRPIFTKAGLTHWIATQLEPRVVRVADALAAVSDETLDNLRARGLLRNGLPVEIIPIGADPDDHRVAAQAGRNVIAKGPGEFALAYLGTITERMLPSVRALFHAVRQVAGSNPALQLTLGFIGTSAQPDGKDTHSLNAVARECGISGHFRLEPRRVGYLDALRTMQGADALLLIGSTDSHYTASKIFPYWLSGKPIVGLVHARSEINNLARELGGVRVVNYDDSESAESRVNEAACVLREVMEYGAAAVAPRNDSAFERYSAHGVAHRFACLFDRVLGERN